MYSVIVFSERCTFKNVTITNNNVGVLKRNCVDEYVSYIFNNSPDVLSAEAVEYYYNKLYPFTQLSENNKIQHITNIQNGI